MVDSTLPLVIGHAQAIGRRPLLQECLAAEAVVTGAGLPLTLAVVADGGHSRVAGERAARLATDTVLQACRSAGERQPARMLYAALTAASAAVYSAGQQSSAPGEMSCAATLAAVHRGRLYLAHVGKGRVYLIRGQHAVQLTADHTWAYEMLRSGKRTPEELETHPNRDHLGRALGRALTVEVDQGVQSGHPLAGEAAPDGGLPVYPGDCIVVCSDGLAGPLGPDEIAATVRTAEPQQAAERLVELAARYGEDSASLVMLEITGEDPQATGVRARPSPLSGRRILALSGLFILLLALVGLGIVVLRPRDSVATAPPPTPIATSTLPPSEEQVSIARLIAMKGAVEADPPGDAPPYTLEAGDTVAPAAGELVRVVGPGRLRLALSDGSVLFLDSDTEIELRQIAGQDQSQTLIQLNQGRLLVAADPLAGQEFYVLAETGARAQVIGSLMGVEYDPDVQHFEVDCLAGRCRLLGRNGDAQELRAGEHSGLYYGRPAPPDPARYELYVALGDPGDVLTATATSTPGAVTPSPTAATPTSTPTGTSTRSTRRPTSFPTATKTPPVTSTPASGPTQPSEATSTAPATAPAPAPAPATATATPGPAPRTPTPTWTWTSAPAPLPGKIIGKVKDETYGYWLEGATVRVDDTGQSCTTGSNGQCQIKNVPAGTHNVTASKAGYESRTASATVNSNQASTIEFGLPPLPLAPTATPTTPPPPTPTPTTPPPPPPSETPTPAGASYNRWTRGAAGPMKSRPAAVSRLHSMV